MTISSSQNVSGASGSASPASGPRPLAPLDDESRFGFFARLPPELTVRILCVLIPEQDCPHDPGEAHSCVVSQAPAFRVFSRFKRTCTGFNNGLPHWLARVRTRLLQTAATREFETGMRDLYAQLGTVPMSQAEFERAERNLRDDCRRLYGLDPVPESAAKLPFQVIFNHCLDSKDLADLKPEDRDKYWTDGSSHAVQFVDLDDHEAFLRLLDHHPHELLELELPALRSDEVPPRLLEILRKCARLKDLVVHACPDALFQVSLELDSLRGLTLFQPEISADSWKMVGAKTGLKLESLTLHAGTKSNLLTAIATLNGFAKLRELRLNAPGTKWDADCWKALVKKLSEENALSNLKRLQIWGAPATAGSDLTALPTHLVHLSLQDAKLSAPGQLEFLTHCQSCNRLQGLELHLYTRQAFDAEAAGELGKWLSREDCSLRLLSLAARVREATASLLAAGLAGNRSVEYLRIDLRGESESSDESDDQKKEKPLISETEWLELEGDNSISRTIADQLPRVGRLRSLSLRAVHLSPVRIALIAEKALQCTGLIELDLQDNRWNEEATAILIPALKKNKTILRIRLPEDALTEEIASLLLDNLARVTGPTDIPEPVSPPAGPPQPAAGQGPRTTADAAPGIRSSASDASTSQNE